MNHPVDSPPTEPISALAIALLKSLGVMIPWPIVGIALSYGMFDQADEAILLFGGVTGLFLVPIMMIGDISEMTFGLVICVVWGVALLLPPIIVHRRFRSRGTRAILLGLQSAFSLAQAAMGILMILGKDV